MHKLSSHAQEIINRNMVTSLMIAEGYNVFLPVFDEGVDFIIYREKDNDLRKIQLKGRWTVDKKYVDREIWITFPYRGEWYMLLHDDMLTCVTSEPIFATKSWIENGNYSRGTLSSDTLKIISKKKLIDILKLVVAAARQAEESNGGELCEPIVLEDSTSHGPVSQTQSTLK